MARKCAVALLLLAVTTSGVALPPACEPIAVHVCRSMGYNHTGLSTIQQKEAEYLLQTYNPLVQYGCSAQLQLFLCSVYVPMCTEKVNAAIGPCRGLCHTVRRRCLPVLQGFGFPWPATLNCSLFPAHNNHETMCMEGPGEDDPAASVTLPAVGVASTSAATAIVDGCAQGVNRCQPPVRACDAEAPWSSADKRLAESWATGWAALGFAASLLAVASLAVDARRARYPARPLAFVALSHGLAAVGWAVRATAGRGAVACNGAGLLLWRDGLANANCAVVFLLLYYFGTAASVWWVVLALAWFLVAGGGWAHERVQQQSSLFHLAGWGLPAANTVVVLVLRHVDADELTGVCFVGNQSSRSLMLFVLAPQFVQLCTGSGLLLAGWWGWRRRRQPQGDLGRLGAVACVCAAAAAVALMSLLVEYNARLVDARPPMWAPLVRLAAAHVGAIAAAAWICTSKTLRAWRRLGPCKQPPVKCHPVPVPVSVHYYHAPPMQPPPFPHKSRKHRKHGSETTV